MITPLNTNLTFTLLRKPITKEVTPLKSRTNSLLQDGHFDRGQNGEAPIANAPKISLKSQNPKLIQQQHNK